MDAFLIDVCCKMYVVGMEKVWRGGCRQVM